jgi:hypothetical protein
MEVIFSPRFEKDAALYFADVHVDGKYIVGENEGLTDAQVKQVAMNLYNALSYRVPTLIIEV